MTLFSKSRRGILGLLFSHPDQSFYLRQIVELTGLAMGQVQRELKSLSGSGVLRRTTQGRHVYFCANDRCPVYEELRGIVLKTMGAVSVLASALEQLSGRIDAAFVFGSVARGQETNVSDLDVMVVGDASFAEVTGALAGAENTIRREVNVTVYPAEELRSKVDAGHHFVNQVLRSEKLFVMGDQSDLEALLEQPVDS